MRRGSLDGYSSPPDRAAAAAVSNGYFPHDLDDIYEYKTDHQYFTHTGASNQNCHDKFSITSEAQRNSLFRNHVQSVDDYGNRYNEHEYHRFAPRNRFDNSSFIRNLNSSISQNSVDSGNNTSTTTSSNNSKEKLTSKSHHHHSIHEMIKHFGKKVHIWPRNRHDSINENGTVSNNHRSSISSTTEPQQPDNFRSRSKSLDVTMSRKVLDDCESTYKIYNKILKEGKGATNNQKLFTFSCTK